MEEDRMKTTKMLLALLLLLMLPLAIACGPKEQAESDDPDDTATATSEQAITSAVRRQARSASASSGPHRRSYRRASR